MNDSDGQPITDNDLPLATLAYAPAGRPDALRWALVLVALVPFQVIVAESAKMVSVVLTAPGSGWANNPELWAGFVRLGVGIALAVTAWRARSTLRVGPVMALCFGLAAAQFTVAAAYVLDEYEFYLGPQSATYHIGQAIFWRTIATSFAGTVLPLSAGLVTRRLGRDAS